MEDEDEGFMHACRHGYFLRARLGPQICGVSFRFSFQPLPSPCNILAGLLQNVRSRSWPGKASCVWAPPSSSFRLSRCPISPARLYGGFPKLGGSLIGGPYNKDYSILGSILGSPHFGKLPYVASDGILMSSALQAGGASNARNLPSRGRRGFCAYTPCVQQIGSASRSRV